MRILPIAGVALLACVALPSRASGQDMDAMSRWANAKVIHYHVVGDFSGGTKVLKAKDGPAAGSSATGKVSDHVEFDFDWDQMQQKPVADPIFKNFPTKVESLQKTCGDGDPKVNGPFEYFTFESVRATGPMLTLHGKREIAPGSLQYGGGTSACTTGQTPAATELVTARMQVALGMLLVMPATPGLEMEISKDHKSIIQKVNTDGWVWTMTPTIVR